MEELENQLPQGGEEEIVEEEELALPDMTDLGGAQLEAVKQANEQSSGILGIANQVSGAIEMLLLMYVILLTTHFKEIKDLRIRSEKIEQLSEKKVKDVTKKT